jgi:hypothetical protein
MAIHGMRLRSSPKNTCCAIRSFGTSAASQPVIDRYGVLPTGVCGAGGSVYALLQLSDKSAGRDFDSSDEEDVRELAALIGETLDAPRAGVRNGQLVRH